ncbi:MAG: PD-(D/E)XK nuclease family protein [Clostridia bacterium]|nr:PD-(D/E)XK nuclease family protein [Clostridia bacterium]
MTGRPENAGRALVTETGKALQKAGDVYVIVPKQLTLQTELTLIRALEPGGSFRLNVMSPERLCARIFETAGQPQAEKVDDRGRVMLARRALNKCDKELTVYSDAGHRRGFPARAARQLELFRQAGLTPEEIDDVAAGRSGLFAAKLRDMAKILSAYMDTLGAELMDGEGEFLMAAGRAGLSEAARCAGMIFYGFDITPRPMHELIAQLARACDVTMIFAADADIDAADADCFAPVNRAIGRMRALCAAAGADVETARYDAGDDWRHSAVKHISRNMFAAKAEVFEGECDGLRLMALKDPRAEAAYVAGMCRQLAMNGARWNDMMVVSPDISGYARCLEDAFAAFGIPIFLSSSRPASRHALAEALLSAIRLVWKGFRTQDALALIRTGYAALENPDALTNYMLRYEPRGKALSQPFIKGGDEALEAEADRERLIGPVNALRENLRTAEDLKGQLTALFTYLTDIGAYTRSLEKQDELIAAGLPRLAGEESQVWNRIISTLDQMAALMGEKKLSYEDLYETLQESLDSAIIKPLPQSGDAVYAQSLDAAVMREADHIFVIGLSDRVYSGMDGMFTDRQMTELSQLTKKYLCADATEKALMRRYYFKTALAAAKIDVTFTYPLSSEDGAAQRGAALIGDIKRMFPLLREGGGLEDEGFITQMRLSAPGAAMKEAGARLDTEAGRSALATLAAMPGTEVGRLLRAFDTRNLTEQLTPDTAQRLYGALKSASVTRLELFGRCPFSHFMRYALSPEIVEPFSLTVRDEGSFYHDAVRAFMMNSRLDMSGMGMEEADRRMDEVSERLLDRLEETKVFDTAVSRAEKRRLKATARAAAEALVRQISGSAFAPVEMELEFGREDGAAIKLLTESGECTLEGHIDRIDEWENPGEDFLRVIDYKRGGTELKLCEAYYGLQLQLIVYLAAAMRRRGDSGAGVYYFRIEEGIIADQSVDAAIIEEKRRSAMKLTGMTLAEKDVIDAMATDSGDVINVKINKDGSISKVSTAVERDAIDLIVARTLDRAAAHVDGIRMGEAEPSPARTRRSDPCKYCDFRSACHFDDALDAARVRRFEDVTNDEVITRLREENEG